MVLKRDFYYGALLINLIKEGFAPAIIENREEHQVYELVSDHGEYLIFAKYRSGGSGSVWNFRLTEQDKHQLTTLVKQKEKTVVISLVCGAQKLQDSHIVYLTYKDLQKVASLDQSDVSFNVHSKKGSPFYRIYEGKYEPEKAIMITKNKNERLKEIRLKGNKTTK